MITPCHDKDNDTIFEIINDAAIAYRGVIPPDCWHEPYMSMEELKKQIADGVKFWKYVDGDEVIGVMGIQDKGDVTLIRHAYTRTASRQKGIGSALLNHLRGLATTPILIGAWTDAHWAIRFYEKHGFRLLNRKQIDRLLRKYWTIPERMIETSVVLASEDWRDD